MVRYMTADQAAELIQDGDCICVNSFVGIENPVQLHEAIARRYEREGSPKHLTMVSSAGFGVWDDKHNAEGYIRDGAVDKLICGHFGAMMGTKKLVLEDRFEAYNLPLGCISHAIRAQACGQPGAFSKVGLDIFVDPDHEGPGINNISHDDTLVRHADLDGEDYLFYKLPKLNVALIKGTMADRNGNISFDDQYMSGDALSIVQAVKANHGTVIVQVDGTVKNSTRPRNAVIPGCLIDAIVVVEAERQNAAFKALSGSFGIPYEEWDDWYNILEPLTSEKKKVSAAAQIIGRRASRELKKDDIVNIGIGIPETISRFARKTGILKDVTLTIESGSIGGFPASGTHFGAMIGATSVYDIANMFDLYDSGGLDICFMGALEVDRFGNVNSHRGPGAFSGIGGFANITAKTPTVVFCLTFNTKGLEASRQHNVVTIESEGTVPKFVENVKSISFSARRARENHQHVLYVTERCLFELGENGLILKEVYPGIDAKRDILDRLPFEVQYK